MGKIEKNHVAKIGIIVDDIEAAAKHYAEVFGIDMPEIGITPDKLPPVEGGRETYTQYKGGETAGKVKYAVIPLEPIYIELIQVVEPSSPWNDYKEKHGEGVNTITLYVDDLEKDIDVMKTKGYSMTFKQEKGKQRYAYFDTRKDMGITLDLKEVDK